jgi:hypothetical protein
MQCDFNPGPAALIIAISALITFGNACNGADGAPSDQLGPGNDAGHQQDAPTGGTAGARNTGDGSSAGGTAGTPDSSPDAFVEPEAGTGDAAIDVADSATGRCSGIADSCSLATTSTCESVRGCTLTGSCWGTPRQCSAFTSISPCINQRGCTWGIYDECIGSAHYCNLVDASRSTCTAQVGCNWREDCTGTPTPCSELTLSEREAQPGCLIEY